MLVKSFRYLVTRAIHNLFRTITHRMEADDFETIVHARNKQIMLAFSGWMPLYSPGSASDIHIR